jgi:hypothetical protein
VRFRLTAAALLLLFAASLMAAPEDEEEDRLGGQLIFNITKVLSSTPNLDPEARSALESSLEFLFLQLQRSPTRSAAEALARTVVLRIDAGGGQSRTEAILSKGPQMRPLLKKALADDYQRLCVHAMRSVCMSEADVAWHVAGPDDALVHGRTVPD